eukprot:GFYU01003963.1.p1 GENE.GFYU01003963.1~~GFYU01003963.1.p1  ORF type:complete len:274 (-),score=61.16 GFYU01003963.1:117-863(-)
MCEVGRNLQSAKTDCGFFRILRGTNEVEIESSVAFATPCVEGEECDNDCDDEPPLVSPRRIDWSYHKKTDTACCVYVFRWATNEASNSFLSIQGLGRFGESSQYSNSHSIEVRGLQRKLYKFTVENTDMSGNTGYLRFSFKPQCNYGECVHGSCEENGSCACDEGYHGHSCDTSAATGCGVLEVDTWNCTIKNRCPRTEAFTLVGQSKTEDGMSDSWEWTYKMTLGPLSTVAFGDAYGIFFESCQLVT